MLGNTSIIIIYMEFEKYILSKTYRNYELLVSFSAGLLKIIIEDMTNEKTYEGEFTEHKLP